MSRTARDRASDGGADRSDVVAIAPGSIDGDARVRDFDQLSESAQRAFVSEGAPDAAASDLERDDVVRYTDYYLVL
ncbi:hypothetical protein [Halopelagius longus]|uniref:Uncharacterized protein n=1 Tax=Halopelagius longus TaxID=1236180 RepID=A0A1H0Y9N2_9EURY|nr:hypothetical protein [Halopelagius longus]RDI72365.1 hypothetical protein DWB78_11925 [Halopelagius longus]SDQ11858.1 hypothetical protein SAMN05216278_0496 [Halopelagius longus]